MLSLFRGKVPLCCDSSYESRDIAPGSEGLSETPSLCCLIARIVAQKKEY